jgi:tetratricopeptide (TPR) repeat protein
MLSKKLEEVRLQTRNQRLRNLIYLLGTFIIIAAFLAGIIKFDFEKLGFTKEKMNSQDTRELMSMAKSKIAGTQQSAVAGQHNFQKSSPRLSSSLGSSTPSINKQAGKEREAFKKALAKFEQEFLPQIIEASFSKWSTAARQVILEGRDGAVNDFGMGSYTTAIEKLSEITDLAASELRSFDKTFDAALIMAHTALEVNDQLSALSSVNEALRLKPNSVEAKQLKLRIDRLAEIFPLIEAASIARVENDLEKEERFLKSALAIDSSIENLKKRLEVVSNKIRESEFASFIDAGMSAIGDRDIKEAQRNLKLAKAMFKSRRELNVLAARTERLNQELRMQMLLEKAHAAAEADSWLDAQQIFKKANEIFPSNKTALKGRALAEKINSSDRQMLGYIRAPQRLTSPGIVQSASVAIEVARTVAHKSPKITAKIDQLLVLISAYSAEVSVTVISDGKTKVSVRGVGMVGKTSERKIRLKPGEYTFEGARPGFRSKLVAVSIPLRSKTFIVEIMCDERI